MSSDLEKFAAINVVTQRFPEWDFYSAGWKRFLADLYSFTKDLDRDSDAVQEYEDIKERRRVPDLWAYNGETRDIVVIEIEDASPMTMQKIDDYYWISEYLCELEPIWRLRLYVTNRYGTTLDEIPLDAVPLVTITYRDETMSQMFKNYNRHETVKI